MTDSPTLPTDWQPSRRFKLGFLAFAVLCVIAVFFLRFWDTTVSYRQKVEVALKAETRSGPASDFSLVDLQGRPFRLSDFRGKFVFVNFWASWCAPCRDEMPSLSFLTRAVDPNDIAFLAVSVDEDEETMNAFLQSQPQPWGYTVLRNPDSSIANGWGTNKLPESYLVDREGNLVYKFTGPRDWSVDAAVKILELAGARRSPPRVGT